MNLETRTGGRFMSHLGHAIRHLEKHHGVAMEFWYEDGETGREFDVRGLPTECIGEDREAIFAGDREAHKRAISRAIEKRHDFRRPAC